MGKKFGLGSIVLATVTGAISGVVFYLANNNKFSEKTQENYQDMIDSAKNFGKEVKRAYTSVGNKKPLSKVGKGLKDKTMDLLSSASEMTKSGASDAYTFLRDGIQNKLNANKENKEIFDKEEKVAYDNEYNNDDIFEKTKKPKKVSAKKKTAVVKKAKKKVDEE